ncbi:MAG: hypothetical protein JNL67_18825 [Planctomycetaceae bacterium]|nr:hypothetical protein [Planctomycetaceae bacterium]
MLRKCEALIPMLVGLAFFVMVETLERGQSNRASAQEGPAEETGSRTLADGVLTVVPPHIDVNEGVVYPRPFAGLNSPNYTPKHLPNSQTLAGRTTGVTRYRDTWQLEFAFKELRYLEVKLPLPDGNTQAAGVCYMIYRVRNLDQHLSFQANEAGAELSPNVATPLANLDPSTLPGRFFPAFQLEGWIEEPNGDYVQRAYRDRVLPAAIPQIAAAEKMAGMLLDNVEIARVDLAKVDSSVEVWGVATWLDVDPRVNFASVSVQGLSNAFQVGGSGESTKNEVKTLQINFWRPGDSNLIESQFRLGIAFEDEKAERQQQLVQKYRLPGPELVIDRIQPETGAPTRLGYVPAEFNLENRQSAIVQQLDGGEVPQALAEFIAKLEGPAAENLTVTASAPGSRWIVAGADGKTWTVGLKALTWEFNGEKFQFVGPLDYFWDFRYIF